jgi:hypothetical protein
MPLSAASPSSMETYSLGVADIRCLFSACVLPTLSTVSTFEFPERWGMSGSDNHLDASVLLVSESLVGRGCLLDGDFVSDDKGWIDFPVLDFCEQGPQISLNMRLPRFDR